MKDVVEDLLLKHHYGEPQSKPAPTGQVLQSESKRKAGRGPIKILDAGNIGCFTNHLQI